jgi:large conductance mechanosensitive channel
MEKKGFITEFKEFISRGNVIDMAVGVIIGGAFQSIIASLVADVVMPLISVITGGIDFTKWTLVLGSGKNAPVLHYGNLITAVINFLLMALVIFTFIKLMGHFTAKLAKKPEETAAPTTKVCPYCLSEIPIDAVKCAHCTSDLTN